MISLLSFLGFSLFMQTPAPTDKQPLEKSACFAFVDRDYIFTIEIVKPGVPLLNFVSMTDMEGRIQAKDIRLGLDNRKVAPTLISVETGQFQQPMSVTSIAVHSRSSFGVRLDGDFGDTRQLYGASIRVGDDDFRLVPLSRFDFEALVLKVNHLNLGSPDFSDDWRVLKIEPIGERTTARRRDRESR
jgi:hypothetical protein